MLATLESLLSQGLAFIVPMIILLGLLIFVHELGHFIAAKYFKVRVETFSLGFGPKIVKFVKGDTTYCLSALPLGGYVKMFGDEPGREIPEELIGGSFLHKPVGQRIIIALAGPMMNLFFAAFLFYVVANVGEKALSPRLGEMAQNTPAWAQGFRPHDTIISVNETPVQTWDEVAEKVQASIGTPLNFSVQRGDEKLSVTATPESTKNKNVLSSQESVGAIKGLNNQIHMSFVGLRSDSPLVAAGLATGDHITHMNSKEIKYYKDIFIAVDTFKKEGVTSVVFKAKRYKNFIGNEPESTEIVSQPVSLEDSSGWKVFLPETLVAQVKEDSPAAKAGIQVLDDISAINGTPMTSFEDIVGAVSTFKDGDPPLEITVNRGGTTLNLTMAPQSTDLEDRFGIVEKRFTIGIVPLKNSASQTFEWVAPNFKTAVSRAMGQTWEWTEITCLSFVRMLQGRVPTKNIGGFISIGQVASTSWSHGIGSFLKIMAIISINLFILNLLPIPILDGGHLVLFFLEALKGSPLSLKKIQFAQQVGFLFILFLMAFALMNDISRLFDS